MCSLTRRWWNFGTCVCSDYSGLKIGIAWQGSIQHPEDAERSIPLAEFAPLAQVPGIRLLSLQKGLGQEQIADVPFQLIDPGSELDGTGAFMDTTAVMMNLDLVITSDTAIAHLAGTLGVRVWVALKFNPDFRWLLERADSPWYPTMRLYRQRCRAEWAGVFEEMAVDLAKVKEPRTQ